MTQNTDSAEDLLSDIDMVEKPSESVPVPTLPVPLCGWRLLLIGAVFLYSSFTIFVHLCEVDGRLPFLSASVIFLVELLKLVLSLVMFGMHHGSFAFTSSSGTHTSFIDAIRLELRQNLMSSSDASRPPPSLRLPPLTYPQLFRIVLPFMIPAVLYAVNNNLGIFIQLEMDPATYQVLGNFKILSTAILFRLIIRRPISPIQWFALFLLLSAGFTHSYGSLLAKSASPLPGSPSPLASTSHRLHITVLGIFLIALYCTISGLSGVTTEYLMKQRAQMNIHLQNALLYTFGIILNGLMFVVEVHKSGDPAYWNPFKGYTLWTWLLILTQSVSGIFMGFVMKYSNNITRLFLISSAMLVTTFTAMLVFGLHLNFLFIVSFLLVCISLFLYHR
ncbi:probable UDP-sugar transporter protein SLC35A4 [Clonorchis sinensis]|uniref:Probable UDP-sugar transporter protein SLC35A4 n=1 Tax=Clonorchis sinensis TaxID=79923 RepID=G7Y674_CLOSI|nr:probable UDP-sugar transporter protein SLC35A4 [Clonorchis sinensis]